MSLPMTDDALLERLADVIKRCRAVVSKSQIHEKLVQDLEDARVLLAFRLSDRWLMKRKDGVWVELLSREYDLARVEAQQMGSSDVVPFSGEID